MNTVLQKTNTFLLIIGFIFISFIAFTQTVSAQIPTLQDAELIGYAWSSNIGWISLNCRNNSWCGTSDYKVTVAANGNLSGHAWSSNIGWIQFNGLSGYPTTGGNGGGRAKLISGGSNLVMDGFAKVISYGGTSGPDGWISFKGTTPDYRVEFGGQYNVVNPITASSSQSAWAPDDIGWIDFNTPHSRVSIDLDPIMDTFWADDTVGNADDIVSLGDSLELVWNIQGFDTCTASNSSGNSDWNGSVSTTNGENRLLVTPSYPSTTYDLSCTNNFRGETISSPADFPSITVEARPDITIDSFSLSSSGWNYQPDGTWDNVTMLTSVSGMPNGESTNYRFVYTNDTHPSSNQTITGTVTGTGAGVIFNPPLILNNFAFGTSTYVLQIDLDAAGSGPGSIQENIPGTAYNENGASMTGGKNSYTLDDLFTTPAGPTVFSIDTPDGFVRYGETTEVDWEVETPYVLDCRVVGPGIDESFSTNEPPASPLPQDYTDSQTTSSLTSSGSYTVTCTERLTGVTFSTTKEVEVIPKFEEV